MRMVVRGVKRNKLTVLGAVAVEISTGGITSYQILYVTEETKQLILSRMCLGQLGVVSKDFYINRRRGGADDVRGGEQPGRGQGRVWVICHIGGPQATKLNFISVLHHNFGCQLTSQLVSMAPDSVVITL